MTLITDHTLEGATSSIEDNLLQSRNENNSPRSADFPVHRPNSSKLSTVFGGTRKEEQPQARRLAEGILIYQIPQRPRYDEPFRPQALSATKDDKVCVERPGSQTILLMIAQTALKIICCKAVSKRLHPRTAHIVSTSQRPRRIEHAHIVVQYVESRNLPNISLTQLFTLKFDFKKESCFNTSFNANSESQQCRSRVDA